MTRPQAPTAPSAPRANPPPVPGAAATKALTPRAPAVAPARVAPAVAPAGAAPGAKPAGRLEEEPPSGGWDAADTVTSFPEPSELPAPTPRHLPETTTATATTSSTTASAALEKAAVPVATAAAPVAAPVTPAAAPATPASPAAGPSPGTMRARYETSPGVGGPPVALSPTGARGITATSAASAQASLGTAMREEVWSIVRAAVEEAMGPLVARQRELEARVERAERETDAERNRAARTQNAPSTAPQGGGSGLPKLALGGGGVSSIPVALGPSVSPPALSIPANATVPDFKLSPAESPTRPAAERPREKTSAHPVGPRPSIPVNGYGVSVITAPRPTLDLESVGPVDIDGFDGGKSKKRVATFVVVIMLLLIVGAVTMTILSHS